MSRVVVPPKLVSETRTDVFDYSPYLPVSVTLVSATATISVYSGIDSSPSSVLSSVSVSASPYASVKVTGGVAGVIYQVNVLGTLSDAELIPLTYFLAVIPDVT